MIYSTPEFFVLMAVTGLLFWLCGNRKARFAILLSGSLFFYAWAGLADFAVFSAVVITSWTAAFLATRFPGRKKLLAGGGIAVTAGHLFIWKYAPWLVTQVQLRFPGFMGGTRLVLPLPIGISFFTLQGIAYLADILRGDAGLMGFSDFLLFKSFFPQLVAGPIVRVQPMLPQLKRLSSPSWEQASAGLALFAVGFFKKVAVADRVAVLVDTVFAQPRAFGRASLLLGLLGYSVQIWADFSGYTDMGRGAAGLLGIRLPENFLSPYLARSPSEFWRRWHISLSEWIRDYIYIPLGGSRGGGFRIFGVAILTMSISGLWHGANWTFLIWGIYHGALLALERAVKGSGMAVVSGKTFGGLPAAVKNVAKGMLTFGGVAIGWLIFRSQSLGLMGDFLSQLFWSRSVVSQSIPGGAIVFAAAVCLAHQSGLYQRLGTPEPILVGWLKSRMTQVSESAWRPVWLGAGLALIFIGALLLRPLGSEGRNFIYFQF